MKPLGLVLSCEHGGREVPAAYRAHLTASARTLASHRGYDPGAHELARCFAARLDTPLNITLVTRLLVDCNRSQDSATLWSPFLRGLDDDGRTTLLAHHYHPYRERVRAAVRAELRRARRVVHLSVHSFTPVLRGERRPTDVGLLFDPKSRFESAQCARWRAALLERDAALVVHDNRPYRGDADGLTTSLRAELGMTRYAGIELEVNQRFPRRGGRSWQALMALLADTFAELLPSHRRAA